MTSLQERRDTQTRAELSTVAIRLFAERGYVETTMEDVALAAGVSRRTAYRHFPKKEDLIFEQPRQWLTVFRAAVESGQPGETTRAAIERGVRAVTETILATKDDVLPGYRILADTPSLSAPYAAMARVWLDEYTNLLNADHPPDDTASVMRSSIIAGALVGGTDRATFHWFLNPSTDLRQLIEIALRTIAPLWPDP